MIRLTDTELAAIRADSEQFIPPGIGDTQRMLSEIAELKAECEGLRATLTDCSDSLHSEMLGKFGGQMPDDMHPVTRREYDRDMAEVAGYRAVLEKGASQ